MFQVKSDQGLAFLAYSVTCIGAQNTHGRVSVPT